MEGKARIRAVCDAQLVADGRGAPARAALCTALCALAALLLAPAGAWAHGNGSERNGPVIKNLSYGPGENEVADVYPAADKDSPLVILIHGGGWRKQAKLGKFELASHGLQGEGSTVVEVNYEQDTQSTPAFPMEPDDVIAAARWAVANASSWNANPGELILLGGSAGGNLAAVAAEELDAATPGMVTGVVTLSGPTNFITLVPLLEKNTTGNEDFNTSVHRALGWNEPESEPFPQAYAERWSPALHVPGADCPSWLIFNSSHEFMPLSQATGMQEALSRAKCPVKLEVVPGEDHSFAYFHIVKQTVYAFIRSLP